MCGLGMRLYRCTYAADYFNQENLPGLQDALIYVVTNSIWVLFIEVSLF